MQTHDTIPTRSDETKKSGAGYPSGVIGCGVVAVLILAALGYGLWTSGAAVHRAEADLATTLARPSAPDPSPKQIEAAYVTFIRTEASVMANSLRRISTLTANPRPTDDWTLAVAAEIATWGVVRDETARRNPPRAYVVLHRDFLAGLDHYVAAGDLLARGIDTGDAALIGAATAEMTEGTAAVQDATRAISAVAP
jgi:hypothetical protein